MASLENEIAIMGKPYALTRSRLGAITKVYDDKYICDLTSLKEMFQMIDEKLSRTPAIVETPEFSFLISFADQTHHDGVTADFKDLKTIPVGKETERVVLKWMIKHRIEGYENELAISVRISNPINPFIYLQAALSKSPNDIDNMEFEGGSTCVTVDGAGQSYSDEIFLLIQNWINARNKPHAFINVGSVYSNFEWYLDQFNRTIFPLLVTSILSFMVYKSSQPSLQLAYIPVIISAFFVFRSIGDKINSRMADWARRSRYMGLFQLTNGDIDSITKMGAQARNGAFKLIGTSIISFILNLAAGITCWWLLPS